MTPTSSTLRSAPIIIALVEGSTFRVATDDGEASIDADGPGLSRLGDALRAGAGEIAASGSDPAWPRSLNGVRIQTSEGALLQVYIASDDWLVIVGSSESLRSTGDNVSTLLPEPVGGDHLHLEWYDGHPFFDPGSLPLVVSAT